MSKLINKMLGLVGWTEEDEEEVEQKEEYYAPEEKFNPNKNKNNSNKVVNIHSPAQYKVVVLQPETFEDAQEICDNLKAKKPVIINLEEMDLETAKKVIDFLSGCVYALDGNIQKVSNGIFLVAPYNVDIMGNFKDELRSTGVFPFLT